MRVRQVSAGLTLAVMLPAALAGCAGGSPSPASSPRPGSSRQASAQLSPAITPAAARAVLATYERVNNTANAQFNSGLEATVETAAQLTVDQVGYVIQKHENRPYAPFTYRSPVFYIPSLPEAAPRWFAADAISGSGQNTEHQLLLFAQQGKGAPWKLAAAPVSVTGRRVPVALSSAGIATTAAAGDPGLAIAPAQLPARHAELLNGQSTGAGFAEGRWSSALIQGIKASRRAYGKVGWKYRVDWAAAGYPVYALRTKDGGAVAWYFLTDRAAAVRAGSARPLLAGGVVLALTGRSQVARRFTIDSVSELVAIIPPRGKGKVAIQAGITGNVAATGS